MLFHGRVVSSSSNTSTGTCRDDFLWPFATTSIWNTPLGAAAKFVPAHLFDATSHTPAFGWLQVDVNFLIRTVSSDPLVPWYNQQMWGFPATEERYCNVTGPLAAEIHFPSDVDIQHWANNNAAAILQPDNRTLVLTQPLYVCTPGAPVLSIYHLAPDADIRGEGAHGGQGGSNLSAMGGTIRRGELLPGSAAIMHALKIELYGHDLYYRPPDGNHSQCYMWPATTCDSVAFECATSPTECYNGTDPNIRPGALLAVPPSDVERVNASLTTEPARLLLAALSTFGAYIVDNTAWNATAICAESGVEDEFEAAWGFAFKVPAPPYSTGAAAQWYTDSLTLFRALAVVVSNGPDTPGGGGKPLLPPPPPFCDY